MDVFHIIDVTCGPPVVMDVVWKIATSFNHFNQSDSVHINANVHHAGKHMIMSA